MSLNEIVTENRGCFWSLIQYCPCDVRGDRFTIGAIVFDPASSVFAARVSDRVAEFNEIMTLAEYPLLGPDGLMQVWGTGYDALVRRLGEQFDRTQIEVACEYVSTTTRIRVTPPLGLLLEEGSSLSSRLEGVYKRSVASKLVGSRKRTKANPVRAVKPQYSPAK